MPIRIGWIFGLLILSASAAGVAQGRQSGPADSGAAHAAGDGVRTTAKAAQPVVMNVRIGEHPDRTRFVVETSDPVKIRLFTLANPDRVVAEMPEVLWRLGGADRPTGEGAVNSYRYGVFRPGSSRFVIDLRRPVRVGEPMILPPQGESGYRIVLDLWPTTQEAFEEKSGWPADLRAREAALERAAGPSGASSTPDASVAAPSTAAEGHTILLDAGHGGIDSGTKGIDGETEKDLVLDEALRLDRLLERRGYFVRLTRRTDIYVPLWERVKAARTYHADLLISLHADSNPDPSVFGASVYTLSEASSDRQAAALARKENQSDIVAGVDLSNENSAIAPILIGLAQRETMNRSARLAQGLVAQLGRATDILPRAPHRSAGFVVLKDPDVPAVLIELGYLSNPQDCAQMATELWRDRVASAIADAVDRQFLPLSSPVGSAQAAR